MLATTRLPPFEIVVKLGWILNFIFYFLMIEFWWVRSQGTFWCTENNVQRAKKRGFDSAHWFSKHVPGISMDITNHTSNELPLITSVGRHPIGVETIAFTLWGHLNLYEHAIKATWIWKIIKHDLPIICLNSSLATKFVDWDSAGMPLLATQPRIIPLPEEEL